ncbi:MAG: PQQ-dependent sugar dehydrogenase [Flavobacteriales bacterium]|nr:PQQ-dependent sugar dehydrogenase [Flavobacteriales bacterium]MCX7767782.1 PQQ-dependent sugar dehydrogenase [Flavobacteriales bacterium]MDW8410627.1 PQQ-dependent sugar dehydrogenase [Flavobacteriales bacterium]
MEKCFLPALLALMLSQCKVNPPLALSPTDPAEALPEIRLPEGFRISLFARVKNARAMTLSPSGILFVGSRKEGKVYAVLNRDGDLKADEVVTVASGLHMPTGVCYHQGDLYVSEVSRILVFENIDKTFRNQPVPKEIPYRFPSEEHHGWKYIRFGPDGLLYVPVGAPCNVCLREDDPRFATIMRLRKDGTGAEIVARGVRNSVGFDWNPLTGTLWFTDNGRDWMGDDLPPCELNACPKPGLHFGFPYCHGSQIPDPDYGRIASCQNFTPPAQELGPHVAPLGMTFYTHKRFPQRYHNGIFIAEHGSWNRSTPIGYRVTFVPVQDDKALGYEVFASGWLRPDGSRWGRPVDVITTSEGHLLVSDDYGDAIYIITYDDPKSTK